ncbi:hypothetical protein SCYAM73S_08178 [Streptomyces cyaneofuscatus]
MAGADQEFGVRPHERGGHRHRVAVRQDELGAAVTEVLDDGEEVVPAAGVQPGGVVAQLVEDLFHLVRGGDRLDQDRRADGALWDADVVLGEDEDVVPEAGLQVRLRLREVEVRALAEVDQALGVVEEVKAEVDQRAGHGGAVQLEVALVQVPAARAGDDGGELVGGLQRVRLAGLRVGEVDAALVGVGQVELAEDHVLPGGSGGVLEVGEPDAGARVERVDRHLAVGRTGDLHPAVVQRRRGGRDLPGVVRADRRRLGQEVQRGGAGDLGAALGAPGEQLIAARRELPVQLGHEREGRVGQDLFLPGQGLGIDDGQRGRRWCGHELSLLQRAAASHGRRVA